MEVDARQIQTVKESQMKNQPAKIRHGPTKQRTNMVQPTNQSGPTNQLTNQPEKRWHGPLIFPHFLGVLPLPSSHPGPPLHPQLSEKYFCDYFRSEKCSRIRYIWDELLLTNKTLRKHRAPLSTQLDYNAHLQALQQLCALWINFQSSISRLGFCTEQEVGERGKWLFHWIDW